VGGGTSRLVYGPMRVLIEEIENRGQGPLDEELSPDDVFWKVVDRHQYMAMRKRLRGKDGDDAMLRTVLQSLIEKMTPKGNDGVALMKLKNMLNSPKWDETMIRNELAKLGDLLGIRAPKNFKELWMKRASSDDVPEGRR